nr:hypothetical protein [Candidatus Sigynarchaeota archaeon]
MDKKAILAKLNEIESKVKEIRDMLGEASEGSKGADEEEAPSEGESKPVESTRIACPKCGNLKLIQMVDKAKVLYYHQGAPIYAKKGVCSKCGTEVPQ